jgi:hypothetical protein
MNPHAGHPRSYAAPLRGRYVIPLWAGMKRMARTLESAVALFVAELRHLNGVGANASSRRERVRIVKQTLADRGKGLNRCC